MGPSPHGITSQMDAKYQGDETFFGGDPYLPQAAGYAIVVGFGVFFSLFTVMIM